MQAACISQSNVLIQALRLGLCTPHLSLSSRRFSSTSSPFTQGTSLLHPNGTQQLGSQLLPCCHPLTPHPLVGWHEMPGSSRPAKLCTSQTSCARAKASRFFGTGLGHRLITILIILILLQKHCTPRGPRAGAKHNAGTTMSASARQYHLLLAYQFMTQTPQVASPSVSCQAEEQYRPRGTRV